jgi:hypothetical protein
MEFLRVFNTILYENEFQNPQIFQQTIRLFSEHSTLLLQVFFSSCWIQEVWKLTTMKNGILQMIL